MAPPNVLLVLTDQQQASTIEPDSPCATPNLNRIVADGTRFERSYTSNPICSPSRASMLTGVLPHTHGMLDVVGHSESPFDDNLDTWSRRLDELGYTLGYFGKWHVEESGDLEKFGFDEYEIRDSKAFEEGFSAHLESRGLPTYDPGGDNTIQSGSIPNVPVDEINPMFAASGTDYKDHLLYGVHDQPEGTTEHYTYSRAIDFLEEVDAGSESWCLTVSTFGPHDPYLAPREFFEQYPIEDIEKPPNFHDPMADKPNIYRRQRSVWSAMDWEDYATAIAAYYAYCSYIDAQLGRLLDTLEERDDFEDTVVIFASDHGDLMGAHRLFLKGIAPFEEGYRTPLVVRSPAVDDQPAVCPDIVQLHDVGPTIVDLAGDNNPFPEVGDEERTYGATSLRPFLYGECPEGYRAEAYAEMHGNAYNWTQRIYWSERYKYVFNTFDYDELYDLETDPHEMTNLAEDPEYQDVKLEHSRRLWEILVETDDRLQVTNYPMMRFAPSGPDRHSGLLDE